LISIINENKGKAMRQSPCWRFSGPNIFEDTIASFQGGRGVIGQILLSPVRHKLRNFRVPETNLRPLQNIFSCFALLLLLVGATGCVSQIAAGKIITAPNLQYRKQLKESGQSLAKFISMAPAEITNSFRHFVIPVGPPEAKLSVIEMPGQNYHLTFDSKVNTRTNSVKKDFCLWGDFITNLVFQPLKEPATIIILHGYATPKETMMPWALTLAQAGYRVVLVDLRGHGQSTGDRIFFGKHETADLSHVVDYLRERGLCEGKIGVLGLSYGATIALHWAAHESRVATVVAIAPYNQPDEAMKRFAKEMKIPVPKNTAKKALAIAATKLDLKWNDWSGEAAIRQFKQPVLLIGAEQDAVTLPSDIATLKQLAPSGSKSILIPEADHFLIGFWFHDLREPVTTWFHEHLEGASKNDPPLLISERANPVSR
jgi:pimeloyl-ACP methyl ester carboxylesterase